MADEDCVRDGVDTNGNQKAELNDSYKSGNASDSSSTPFRRIRLDRNMIKILNLLTVDLEALQNKRDWMSGCASVNPNWMNKFISADWNEAFTEEGHLRLTCIMDMLPKLEKKEDAHSSLWKSYRRLQCAALALAHYNRQNEGAEYYLVRAITAQPALNNHNYVSHANFLAKLKDDPESPAELFFAEVLYHCDDVTICCPLESRLLPPDIIPPLENVRFKRAKVIHPEGYVCPSCAVVNKRYL